MIDAATFKSGVVAALLFCGLSSTGCQSKRVVMLDVFPKSGIATPWALEGEVWSGAADEAGAAIGDEGERWAAFMPERLWLAVYRHESAPRRSLIVRAWAFASSEQAKKAYEYFSPTKREQIEAGDEACWTKDGIMVLWGHMVIDIFGRGGSSPNPEQAIYLLAFFEKRMPPELPYNPE